MRLSCYVRACANPQGTLTVKPSLQGVAGVKKLRSSSTKSQPWSDLFVMTSTTVLRSTQQPPLIMKQRWRVFCAYCQRTLTQQPRQSADSVTYTEGAAQSAGRQQQAVPR